jgi:hypothetical protein
MASSAKDRYGIPQGRIGELHDAGERLIELEH